jgi:hypothetical protein
VCLEGNYHELEVAPNLEFLVTFSMTLEGVCEKLDSLFHYKLISN